MFREMRRKRQALSQEEISSVLYRGTSGVLVVEILIALSMAAASGAGIMISSQLGRQENEKAVQTFNTAVVCSAGIGIFVIVMGNIFLHPLAKILGSTPQIHDKAAGYLWYMATFSPFLLFSFLLGGLARNDGQPKLAMLALAFGSASNVALDYVFMYPLNMGIAGAALATAIGPVFSVAILLPNFLMKRGNLYFAKPKIRQHNIQRIFLLGFPSLIMEFSIGIITFIYNFAIVQFWGGEIIWFCHSIGEALTACAALVLLSRNGTIHKFACTGE